MINFKETKLWLKVSQNDTLMNCLSDLRENCILLGDNIKNLIPGFTDHSVKHMDYLWTICDSVFLKEEIEKFSIAEAFILGASFYFHDLGMSLASTKEGIEKLMATEEYISFFKRAVDVKHLSEDQANITSLQLTSRALHADNSIILCSSVIPGLGKFIIEKESIRNSWSNYIGEVSASHHWSLNAIEDKLGIRGVIPAPEGGDVDLAFLACALRIIDYAHINSERANYIERLLRTSIDDDSILYWKAQEYINGPLRLENKLKYASNRPIEDVEAWWLFYEMVTGLDKEIIAVSEYLETKTFSKNRFSLDGVLNVKTPKSFSTVVRTLNFEPIDIRFKPDSIERLVEILGGKTLYGNDQYAPLRELLQNCRDAILLRKEVEKNQPDNDFSGRITIRLDNTTTPPKLIIKDNGIGMTSSIIENYLLGIASDYWNSTEFYHEFPNVKERGFTPTGKFGIGFLSVFMIGDNIEVETERKGKTRLHLILKGLGKHGSLKTVPSSGNFGTTISVTITKQDAKIYNNLEGIVKSRAPMLPFPITLNTPTLNTIIEPLWWKNVSQKDFFDFASKWESVGGIDEKVWRTRDRYYYYGYYDLRIGVEFNKVDRFRKWPEKQPEIIGNNFRLLAIPDFGKVILCSKGIAVNFMALSGLTGIVEKDDLVLTASRNQTIMWDSHDFLERTISTIKPMIIDALNNLQNEGMITSRFEFIKKVAEIYGSELLLESTLPWVSIIVPPGHIKLFNSVETIELISKTEEILLSYKSNPWSTESICRNYFPSASDSAIIFPINGIDQPGFGDYSNRDIVVDNLRRQFRENEKEEEGDKYKLAIFLSSLLILISKAWGCTENQLVSADWLKKGNDHLCAYFKKKDFI